MEVKVATKIPAGKNRALIALGSKDRLLENAQAFCNPKSRERILESIEDDPKKCSGKLGESIFYRQLKTIDFEHLGFVGTQHATLAPHERYRRAAASALHLLRKEKVREAFIFAGDVENIEAVAEGLFLAAYEFGDFKTIANDGDHKVSQITILVSSIKSAQEALNRARVISEAVNFARRLGDLPAGKLTPTSFASLTRKAVDDLSIEMEEWDLERLEKEKMSGLLNVGRGSSEEPRMVILRYQGSIKANRLCLVGKGITFDSGGLDIKSTKNMEDMRYDMCGAAAVVATILAVARLRLPVQITVYAALAENMPGPGAVKPGDIYFARNGKSIEVMNTDAEGRLVLADALCLAQEEDPQAIIDVATLTGSIVAALGNIHTGYFSRSVKLAKAIERSADEVGERVWQLPLCEEHEMDMKGQFADITNQGSTHGAGSATAAAFLSQFVRPETAWAHLDIAGTAHHIGDRLPYSPKKGASGSIIRTLIQLAETLNDK